MWLTSKPVLRRTTNSLYFGSYGRAKGSLQLPKLVTGVRFPSPALLFSVYRSRSDWFLISRTHVVVCRRLVVSFNLPRPNRVRPNRGPSTLHLPKIMQPH